VPYVFSSVFVYKQLYKLSNNILYTRDLNTSHLLNSVKIKNDKLYHFNKKSIYVMAKIINNNLNNL